MTAGFGHDEVISIDGLMPPDASFPAALDDAMKIYKSVSKSTNPEDIGIVGTSAGGALTLEMVVKAKQGGLPLPGAIAPGTPMADVTETGDPFYVDESVDNVLVSPNGFCDDAAAFYAHGHDMKDPLLSPVDADMTGVPPTILTTGTRDRVLSHTVRVHRKLRRAGVEADRDLYEGESHARYQFDDRVLETKQAFGDIATFFGKHLGQSSPSATPSEIFRMLRFSANLGFLWPDRPLLERIDAAAAAGFRAVELHWPYDVAPRHVRDRLDRHGLVLLGINTSRGDVAAGENGLGALAGRDREFQAFVDQALDYLRTTGGTALHCMAGAVPSDRRAAAREVLVHNLRIASDKAARDGIVLLLEPLNPADAPGYFYSTADEGVSIIAEADRTNIRLMFDCYHVGRTEGDVIATLERLLPIIGHVQFAAVPNRAEPDAGSLDNRAVFEALARLPYRGWTGAEYKPAADTDAGLRRWTAALGVDLGAEVSC